MWRSVRARLAGLGISLWDSLAALAMFGYTLPPAHLVDTAPAGPPTGHLEQLAAEIPLSATERAMWRELELDLLRRQN